MKLQYICAIAALLALTSCGSNRKDEIRLRLKEKCITQASAGRAAPDPKMQQFLTDYCSCLTDKFATNLSVEELDSLDKMKDPTGNSDIYRRLEPIAKECEEEIQAKIQASRKK